MRLLAAAVIFVVGLVYLRGWQQMQALPRGRSEALPPASHKALIAFLGGLALLALALISPLGYLSTQYFSARIIQHMLIVASVPSLLMLANPVPAILYGLPGSRRDAAFAAVRRQEPAHASERGLLGRAVNWATKPSVNLLTFLCVCWFWYDPFFHQATLRYSWVHALEITSLLTVGLLNWWHITGAWPQTHGSMLPILRILYAFVSIWPVKIIGLIILFINEPFYQYPATFQFTGLHINDYTFGAMIAWIVSGLAYAVAVISLVRSWLMEEENKPSLPESAWATDEAMIAPGIKR